MMKNKERIDLVDLDLTIWEILKKTKLIPNGFCFEDVEIEIEVIDDE